MQEGSTCTLKTSKVSKTDIGTYKCVASNMAGSAECEAQITFEGGKYILFLILKKSILIEENINLEQYYILNENKLKLHSNYLTEKMLFSVICNIHHLWIVAF